MVNDNQNGGGRDPAAPVAVAMQGVVKRFGEAIVLDKVDFSIRTGEVHALLGENGAGKSTLMNILTGIYSADAGSIAITGNPVSIRSPADALSLGIGMVHQHFRLAGPFSGRENIRLVAGALPDLRSASALEARIADVLEKTGLEVSLDTPVARLSVAGRQRIEILKALVLGARILILDEPTAVLTDAEAEALLKLVRALAATGVSVVFITHKLREVMAAGDRVSTLRGGRMVMAGADVTDVEPDTLSRAMVGEADMRPQAKRSADIGAVRLSLENLTIATDGTTRVTDASLQVRAGQIVGIAGVGGNGQQELAEAIVGLCACEAGRITLDDMDISDAGIWQRRQLGVRFVPSDRGTYALAPNLSIGVNLAATAIRSGWLGSLFVKHRRIGQMARDLIQTFQIAGGTGRTPVRLLSGGNAQKAVLARELDAESKLIVAHSPTRGLDVAAYRYIHDRLNEAAERGAAVLLISEDLEEILALADQIHVMSRGLLSTTPDNMPSREEIGDLMLGHA